MEGDVDVELSLEECLQLRLLADDLQERCQEELVCMVLELRESMLLQQKAFRWQLLQVGLDIEQEPAAAIVLPDTEEGLVEVFGCVPSDEQVADYVNEMIVSAEDVLSDVDIEAIALGVD